MPKNLERAKLFVMICHSSDCKKKGAKALTRAAKKTLKEEGVFRESRILKTRCTGNCKRAAICGVLPSNQWIEHADEEGIEKLIKQEIKKVF